MNTCILFLKGFNKLYAQWLLEKLNLAQDIFCNVWELTNPPELLLNSNESITVILQVQNRTELENIPTILATRNHFKIIVWWTGSQMCEEDVIKAINNGAVAVVCEKQDWQEILQAIRDVQMNNFHYNLIITEALYLYCKRNRILNTHISSPANALGNREKKIIELKRSGKTSREIGEILFLSKKTIDKLFGDMYRKFDCNNFFELLNLYEEKRSQDLI